MKALSTAINRWLSSVSDTQRKVFVCRYFYFDSVKDIANHLELSESNVKSLLHRARLDLKNYLQKEELI
jgi:RNA polymerase sigma-70 factor (ECF subfamily)